MSLDRIGVNSLLAVNSWIGVINGNMQSAGRTAYKPTRMTLTDGLGNNRISDGLNLPPSTLSVQSTKIEWGQGSVINSDYSSHFALQGDGFFVLHNPKSGRYYLSRDGEFHWGDGGYLVNSAGLRVVSAGQDYIRYSPGDATDMFHVDGFSRDLERYGNKSFLLVDVMNPNNLRMSQYGATTFELDGKLPLRVKNDFHTTTDGLTFVYEDPILMAPVNDPGNFVVGGTFQINFGNGNIFDWDTVVGAGTFSPNTVTIDQIRNVITAWGGTLGPNHNVRATFDTLTDTLILENTAPMADSTEIYFSGDNANAFMQFFRLTNSPSSATVSTINDKTNILSSQGDIDNSRFAPFLDIGFPGSSVYNALDDLTTLTLSDLTTPTNLTTGNPVYTHNKAAGYVESFARAANSMLIGQSTATAEFEVVMDIKTSEDGELIFGFGQNNPLSFHSGGYDIVYSPLLGDVTLRAKPKGYDPEASSRQVGPTQNILAIGDTTGNLDTAPTHRLVVKLDENQQLTFSINGSTATFNLRGAGEGLSGHLSIRNADDTLLGGGNSTLRLYSLYANFKGSLNATTTGEMVSVSQLDISNVENGIYKTRPKARVIQSALESSMSSLTEYIPMLSLAQKVFSSVSKIISAYNQTVDDLNAILR